MVAAVFHSPLEAPTKAPTAVSTPPTTAVAAPVPRTAVVSKKPSRDFKGFWLAVVPPVLGLVMLVLIWQAIASTSDSGIPKPS
ncbi:MAG: Bicarbonate transport system permease protein CmpB, partial [Pseudomonadota bacterium]